jgi:hypothetical protein
MRPFWSSHSDAIRSLAGNPGRRCTAFQENAGTIPAPPACLAPPNEGALDLVEADGVYWALCRNWATSAFWNSPGLPGRAQGDEIMKTPSELIPTLTERQKVQVAEILVEVEEALADKGEYEYDINPTRSTRSPAVWEDVAHQARSKGWDARIVGAVVTIKKPHQ